MIKHISFYARKGFTLLELSIVLVVMGLVIAGYSVGTELMHQSDLRTVISKVEEYRTAYSTFKDQYEGRPGDIYNATTLWSTASTQNGNENEQITYNTGAGNNEALYAWQHLVLAGLVTGSFSGVGGGTGQQAIPGTNVPKTTVDGTNSGFYIDYTTWHSRPSRNTLFFGATRANNSNGTVILPPTSALSIDKKVDDGLPGAGFAMTTGGRNAANSAWSASCISGSGAGATYQISIKTKECIMGFYLE